MDMNIRSLEWCFDLYGDDERVYTVSGVSAEGYDRGKISGLFKNKNIIKKITLIILNLRGREFLSCSITEFNAFKNSIRKKSSLPLKILKN